MNHIIENPVGDRELIIDFKSGATKVFKNILDFQIRGAWLHIKTTVNDKTLIKTQNIVMITVRRKKS